MCVEGGIFFSKSVSVTPRLLERWEYPSLSCGKEDTLIMILSAWDRSRDSTARRNLSSHM